jgi:hypothetical protein
MQLMITEYLDYLKFFEYALQLSCAMVQDLTYLYGGLHFHVFLTYMDVLLPDHIMPKLQVL